MPHDGHIFKGLILGLDNAATSSFFKNAIIKQLSVGYKQLVGVNVGVHSSQFAGNVIRLQIWDLELAQSHWFSLMPLIRGSHAVIYLVNVNFLHHIKQLRREVQHYCGRISELFLLYGLTKQLAELTQQLPNDQFYGNLTPNQALTKLAMMAYNQYIHQKMITPFAFATINLPTVDMDTPRIEISKFVTSTVSHHLLEILKAGGFSPEKGIVTLQAFDAIFQVNIFSGIVQFIPRRCISCQGCIHKWRNLCLIATSAGWSNFQLKQQELEVIGKIHSIAIEQLPEKEQYTIHTRVAQANKCENYEFRSSSTIMKDPVAQLLDTLMETTT